MRRRDEIVDPVVLAYTEAYKERLFAKWYSEGCPVGNRIMMGLPEDEMGRVPHIEVVKKWIREEWRTRADVLNAEVARQIEKKMVEVRVEMLNRQAEAGKELQKKGMEYLDNHEFQKAGEALKAVIGGAELERASRGLPDALLKVSQMKDEDLVTVLNSLLNKVNPDELEEVLNTDLQEIVDATEVTETDINE